MLKIKNYNYNIFDNIKLKYLYNTNLFIIKLEKYIVKNKQKSKKL